MQDHVLAVHRDQLRRSDAVAEDSPVAVLKFVEIEAEKLEEMFRRVERTPARDDEINLGVVGGL